MRRSAVSMWMAMVVGLIGGCDPGAERTPEPAGASCAGGKCDDTSEPAPADDEGEPISCVDRQEDTYYCVGDVSLRCWDHGGDELTPDPLDCSENFDGCSQGKCACSDGQSDCWSFNGVSSVVTCFHGWENESERCPRENPCIKLPGYQASCGEGGIVIQDAIAACGDFMDAESCEPWACRGDRFPNSATQDQLADYSDTLQDCEDETDCDRRALCVLGAIDQLE